MIRIGDFCVSSTIRSTVICFTPNKDYSKPADYSSLFFYFARHIDVLPLASVLFNNQISQYFSIYTNARNEGSI